MKAVTVKMLRVIGEVLVKLLTLAASVFMRRSD